MSILVINRDKGYRYSDVLPELKNQLVVLSWYPLPDSDEYQYFEIIPNYRDLTYFLEIRAMELHKQYNFTTVIAEDEFDICRASRIREYCGIAGQTVESTTAFHDKVIMKDLLKGKGIVNLPHYRRVTSAQDLFGFIEEHGYPVVLKPSDGAGSQGVHILRSVEDLHEVSKTLSKQDLIVETYVSGEMYHLDAYIEDGELVFFTASRYINKCFEFFSKTSTLGSFQYHPSEPIYQRLRDTFVQIVAEFPKPKVAAYHMEIFHTDDDELVFCEVASRIGGGYIFDKVKRCYNVEFDQLLYRKWCGLPVEGMTTNDPETVTGFMMIPSQNGVLRAQPETIPFDWVLKYDKYGEIGKQYAEPKFFSERIAGMFIEGTSSEDVLEKLLELERWYMNEMKWEPIEEAVPV